MRWDGPRTTATAAGVPTLGQVRPAADPHRAQRAALYTFSNASSRRVIYRSAQSGEDGLDLRHIAPGSSFGSA